MFERSKNMDRKKILVDLKAKASFLSVLCICMLVFGASVGVIYVLNPDTKDIVEKEIEQRINKPVPLFEGSTASGQTVIMYIATVAHNTTPASSYASNLSSNITGEIFEFRDYLNNELFNETPYNTAFDFQEWLSSYVFSIISVTS